MPLQLTVTRAPLAGPGHGASAGQRLNARSFDDVAELIMMA